MEKFGTVPSFVLSGSEAEGYFFTVVKLFRGVTVMEKLSPLGTS
jgi:hypothetical protein